MRLSRREKELTLKRRDRIDQLVDNYDRKVYPNPWAIVLGLVIVWFLLLFLALSTEPKEDTIYLDLKQQWKPSYTGYPRDAEFYMLQYGSVRIETNNVSVIDNYLTHDCFILNNITNHIYCPEGLQSNGGDL